MIFHPLLFFNETFHQLYQHEFLLYKPLCCLPKLFILGHNSKLNWTYNHIKDAISLWCRWIWGLLQTLGNFCFQQVSHWSKIFCVHQDYLYLNCIYTYNLSSCIWITIANMISLSFSYLFWWETSRYFPETFFYLYKCQQMWIFLAFSLEDPKILCPMHSGDSFS